MTKKTKLVTMLAMLVSAIGLQAATDTDLWNHEESNFNDGSLEPFKVCTTAGGNYAKVVSQRAKFVWKEAEYRPRGTRMFLGAEICAERAMGRQEVHTGFKLNIPTATGSIRWPNNKNTIIWQNFMLGGCSSWGAVLEIRNNDLWVLHRSFCGTATEKKIYTNLPRDSWMNIQTHTKVSKNGTGFLHIKLNGSRIYLTTNINHGFGTWTHDTRLAANSKQEQKFGIYAADIANHDLNEERTIYFDNCAVYISTGGGAGWAETDPS